MGWCSATEIIDTAIRAAEKLAQGYHAFEEAHTCCPAKTQEELDNILRPFVASIAIRLRDNDWDCEQDSDYFDRFPQEMTGWDDGEYATWLVERIADDPTGSGWETAALLELQTRKA